jgi:hypothetical protein
MDAGSVDEELEADEGKADADGEDEPRLTGFARLHSMRRSMRLSEGVDRSGYLEWGYAGPSVSDNSAVSALMGPAQSLWPSYLGGFPTPVVMGGFTASDSESWVGVTGADGFDYAVENAMSAAGAHQVPDVNVEGDGGALDVVRESARSRALVFLDAFGAFGAVEGNIVTALMGVAVSDTLEITVFIRPSPNFTGAPHGILLSRWR